METFEPVIDRAPEKEPRPSFLTVLCILSFISIGLALSSGFMGLISGPMSEDMILEQKKQWAKMSDELRSVGADGFVQILDQFSRMLDSLAANHYGNTIATILVHLIGIIGVIFMWQGRKNGFHLYIVYSILSILQLYLFVSPADIPTIMVVVNLLISGLFIFLYSRNLKWMS
jgi:hypothetical protein